MCFKLLESRSFVESGHGIAGEVNLSKYAYIVIILFTSCIRDSMFAFLNTNGFIEHKIQRGFLPKLSGTFEHTAQMANVITNARIKQRSVVTLLDLNPSQSNFGGVEISSYTRPHTNAY